MGTVFRESTPCPARSYSVDHFYQDASHARERTALFRATLGYEVELLPLTDEKDMYGVLHEVGTITQI